MEQLILPDGSAIASGVWGEPAILSVRWQQNRNEGSEITLGSVCCAQLEIELFAPEKPNIPANTRLIYQEDGVARGVFYCQSLTRKSQNRWVLQALDGMHRFYQDINGFWRHPRAPAGGVSCPADLEVFGPGGGAVFLYGCPGKPLRRLVRFHPIRR